MQPSHCLAAIIFATIIFNLTQVSGHINKNEAQRSTLRTTRPQVEKSGWQIVSESDTSITEPDDDSEIRNFVAERNKTRPSRKAIAKIESKSVDWDDDDLNGENHLKATHLNRDLNYLLMVSGDRKQQSSTVSSMTTTRVSDKKSRKNSKNKLVFHGQLKKNATTKVVDGIKLQINTHKPLAISRKTSSLLDYDIEKPSLNSESSPTKPAPEASIEGENKWPQTIETPASSDWKPISVSSSTSVSPTRVRRVGKTGGARSKLVEEIKATLRPKSLKVNETLLSTDQKWRPISRAKSSLELAKHVARRLSMRDTTKPTVDSPIVYGKPTKVVVEDQRPVSTLEEPFDDDDLIITARTSTTTESSLKHRADSSLFKLKAESNRWKPLDLATTTIAPTTTTEDITTTTLAPTTTTPALPSSRSPAASSWQPSGQNSSSLESAQRSASDLNYIYSSQPQPQQVQPQVAQVASSGYYSNYAVPASQQVIEQQPPPSGPIIDTTSGQLPEMIADRVPEAPLPISIQGDSYSMPQNTAQFQPVQVPTRMPTTYYDSSSYGSSSYVQPPRFQQPIQQQVQPQQQYVQPQRQVVAPTQAPQVVRQEHHYHYYNQQQQQQQRQQQPQHNNDNQFDRSQQTQQNNNNNNNNGQQTIIREIQPLLISQPIVAPPSTTTPQPMIIREIVKEVPMQIQPMQVSRIILPQATVRESLPQIQQVREVESPLQFAYAPAQRIMRTISNNMPSVAIRMPQLATLPQIRFPVGPIPMPVRGLASNQAPVTRQTGSFVIPPMPKKTTTYLTETQAMPTHTTIMQTTQFTPATRTTVYTTDHQAAPQALDAIRSSGNYKARRR